MMQATGCHFLFLMPLLSVLITGCDKQAVDKTLHQDVILENKNHFGDKLDDVERMERCRRELDALKKINPQIYKMRKTEFDNLMAGAVIYNGVRNDIGDYTQNAVDALYRFKTEKFCADISADVLNNLSK